VPVHHHSLLTCLGRFPVYGRKKKVRQRPGTRGTLCTHSFKIFVWHSHVARTRAYDRSVLSLALVLARTRQSSVARRSPVRSLPLRDPESLAEVRIEDMTAHAGVSTLSYNALPIRLEQIRDRQQSFRNRLPGESGSILRRAAKTNREGSLVSGDFFNVLGVVPTLADCAPRRTTRAAARRPVWSSVIHSGSCEYGGDKTP